MAGAPSQIDLFDPKPMLTKHDGQDIPDEFVKGERFAFIKGKPKLLASPFQFKSHGQSGAQISELLPNLAKVADDLTIIRSMRTTQFNHAPAQIFMNTGHQVIGRPSLGLVAELRAGRARTATCRASSCCSRARTIPTAASRAGEAASSRPSIRVSSSARAANRCSSSRTPTASTRTCATARSPRSTIESRQQSQRRRPRDRDAHRRLRARLSHADERAGADRPLEGTGSDARVVRHRARPGVLRQQLPARATAGRARRPLRPALPPRLGYSRRLIRRGHRREAAAPCAARPTSRSTGC